LDFDPTQSDYPLVAVVGPTGSGKTALAISLAEQFAGEVVSCDSVAVYREFEIGTAKPSPEERARVPHHMVDIASPDEEITAGDYARQARAVLGEIKSRKKLPIIAGGTGLYLRALIEGLFAGPERSEEMRGRLRERANERGSAHLHRMLKRFDPAAAGRIHANDTPKIIRALEVCFAARAPITALHETGRDPLQGFRILTVGLEPERALLYDRINARCERMFAGGLVDETRALLARHPRLLTRPNSPLNALGYRQAVQHLRGALPLAATIAATAQAHRNYAKRQLTWFRRQHSDVHWIQNPGDDLTTQQRAREIVATFLG
jgi:tRNA dimethylallyltransferase